MLAAQDMAVEGFCRSQNSLHGCDARALTPYGWVGNSASLSPSQNARPIHKPEHRPQAPVLSRIDLLTKLSRIDLLTKLEQFPSS